LPAQLPAQPCLSDIVQYANKMAAMHEAWAIIRASIIFEGASMTHPTDEAVRREHAARQAIKNGFDMEDEDSGAAMFVAFHLEELEPAYWEAQAGTLRPAPSAVLDLLVLDKHWGGKDEMEFFDFTLPGAVTGYVVSVRFDEVGKVDEISMES
jgi:hypothetical protein